MKKTIRKLISILIAVIVVGVPLLFILHPKGAAAWYDENWLYRKAITVTNSTGATLTNIQKLITVDTSDTTKFQADCDDLRFTSVSGKVLPFYIDSGCSTSSTKAWVYIDSLPNGTATVYMYYGNPSASSGQQQSYFDNLIGLVGYWPLNDGGSSATAADQSVNGNNGTLSIGSGGTQTTNTQAWTNGATGKYAGSLNFDNSDDYVVTTSNIGISGASARTMELWFKLADVTRFQGLAYWGTAANSQLFTIGTNGSKLYFAGYYDDLGGPTTLINDTWYHVVITYNGTTLTIYLNGAYENSKNTTLNTTNSQFVIGKYDLSGPWVKMGGQIDDVKIYNTARTVSQISKDYSTTYTIATATSQPTTSTGSEEAGPGPVGYWSFDDGQGTVAQDKSSSNNDGTLSGATLPTWQTEDQCISGKCLYFDGSTSYIDLGNPSALSFERTRSFSIETWVRTSLADTDILLAKEVNNSAYTGYTIDQVSGGKLRLNLISNYATNNYIRRTGTKSVKDGKWHHIVMTYDGSSSAGGLLLFIDGVPDILTTNRDSLTDSIVNSVNLRIGNWDGNSGYWHGFIDEPKIYPYARTAAQIKTDFNSGSSRIGSSAKIGSPDLRKSLSDGLVGYWKMDEATADTCGSSNDSCDSSGNGNNGAWQADTTFTSGKFGNGVNMDGTGDYVDVGSGSSISGLANFTISAWIKPSSLPGVNGLASILSKDGVGIGREWQYGIYNDGGSNQNKMRLVVQDSVPSNTAGFSTTTIQTGSWQHISVTYDATNMKFYLNGVTDGTTPATKVIPSTSVKALIGARCSNDTCIPPENYFNGSIDEVRIYNRALSPKEVSDLYNFAPGPRVQLRMEDGSGTTAVDSSGQGRNATLNGNPVWGIGEYGKGINLDGTGDYVEVPDF